MASYGKKSTPLRPSVNDEEKKRKVTFATSHTSILISAESRASPRKARERIRALRNRKATPHKKKAPRDNTSSPYRGSAAMNSHGKKPRLVESGAVRVQIAKHTNPRRGAKQGSQRLIDQGAVRLNITRHTTPRRPYTRSRIWSPPPSSCKKNKVPQSEKLPNRNTSTTTYTPSKSTAAYTSSKQRSNAHRGGHRFLATLTPNKYSTPAIGKEMHKGLEQPERSLSRTLFD